ncbi:hypothetical protein Tco_1166321 [Tanacetum coccineum]
MGFTKPMRDSQVLLSYTASSSNLQNVAFVSENTSSTNDVSTAYGVCNTSGHNSKHVQNHIIPCLHVNHVVLYLGSLDLEQVMNQDLGEMDLKWASGNDLMRIKKF